MKVVEQTATVDTTGQAAAIDSAEAKGARKITVKFSKALTEVPAKDKVTVTRGNSKKTVNSVAFTDDTKTSIDITVSTALVKGNYDVSIEGVNAEALKAEVAVASDETLTSYEVYSTLVSDFVLDSTKNSTSNMFARSGKIYYRALNQYDEPMDASAPTASTTFGKVFNVTRATATEWGTIQVGKQKTKTSTTTAGIYEDDDAELINQFLCVPGSKGTVVLVDSAKGISKTADIEYGRAAAPAKLTFEGVYNTLTSTADFTNKTLPSRQNADDFYLLYTGETQYPCVDVDRDTLKYNGGTTANVAGGITKVAVGNDWVDVTVGGKKYVGLKLSGKGIEAGSATVTIVNNTVGALVTHTVDVKDTVTIASFTILDSNVYENQKNEVQYQAIDSNGQSVTDFATLNSLVTPLGNGGTTNNTDDGTIRFERQKDGTAKLIYDVKAGVVTPDTQTHKGYKLSAVTFQLNHVSSIDVYKVQSYNFTVNEERKIERVLRVGGDHSFAIRNGSLKIDKDDIVYADQYGNEVTKDDIKEDFYNSINTLVLNEASNAAEVAVCFSTSNDLEGTLGTGDDANKFVFTPIGTEAGSITAYVKYTNKVLDANKSYAVTNSNYDYSFVVNAYQSDQASQEAFKITSVNDGYYVDYREDPATKKTLVPGGAGLGNVEVKGIIAGDEVVIPARQYKVIGQENATFTTEELLKGVETKTAKVIVRVTTWDADNNELHKDLSQEYTISRSDQYVFKVDDVNKNKTVEKDWNSALVSSDLNIEYNELFIFKNQYGKEIGASDAVAYHITVPNQSTAAYKCVANGSNDFSFTVDKDLIVDNDSTKAGTQVNVTIEASVGSTSESVDAVITYPAK